MCVHGAGMPCKMSIFFTRQYVRVYNFTRAQNQFLHVLFQVLLPGAREGQGREYSCSQKEHTGSLQECDPNGGERAPQGGHL